MVIEIYSARPDVESHDGRIGRWHNMGEGAFVPVAD